MTKEIAFKNNVRQIRYLIANNLTRPLDARERDKEIERQALAYNDCSTGRGQGSPL